MEDRVSSANLLNPRKPAAWLIAIAAGAALFASGALVARATLDDETTPAPALDSSKIIAPGIGADSVAPADRPAAYGANDVMTTGGRGGTDMSFPGCQAPLPSGVVADGVINPAKAGFHPALPASGFTANSIGLAVQGQCGADGAATTGDLILTSTWQHDASSLTASITQRATTTKVANVFRQDGATFWANGYEFNVSVNPYRILPASDVGAAPNAGSGAGTTEPAKPGIGVADDRAVDVLRQLVGQLAPTLDQKCFWSQANGDWSSLASAGVGDPRPAIPSGYNQTDLNVIALIPPADGCDTSVRPTDGFSFNAGWQKSANSEFAYIGVSVYSNGSAQAYPGQLTEYGANWSNGALSFGVYGKSDKPLGVETIKAIAKALDPSFNEACFVQDRELSEQDLTGLGFHAAQAPAGYKLVSSSLRAQGIASGCPTPDGFQPSYDLHWTFQQGADTIDAAANRYGASSGDGSGYQSPNALSWTGSDGTAYSVFGRSTGISPTVPKDDLIAVARSMDPSFDIAKLVDGGPDKPIALPAPPDAPKR